MQVGIRRANGWSSYEVPRRAIGRGRVSNPIWVSLGQVIAIAAKRALGEPGGAGDRAAIAAMTALRRQTGASHSAVHDDPCQAGGCSTSHHPAGESDGGTVIGRRGRVYLSQVDDDVWIGGDTVTGVTGIVHKQKTPPRASCAACHGVC